jgi:hypothetical protein
VRDTELRADRAGSGSIEHVRVDVRLITVGGQEPGLDRPIAAHTLDPPAALSEPHVAQSSAEQASLSHALGYHPERTEALIDDRGVDALAVVGTDELVAPLPQRRQPEATQSRLPSPQELRVCGTDPQLDAAAFTPGGGDRRVGVRHQLGNDLREIDPGLREVLAEVAPADTAAAQVRCVDGHEQRINPGRVIWPSAHVGRLRSFETRSGR